jgi:hypothetical protein
MHAVRRRGGLLGNLPRSEQSDYRPDYENGTDGHHSTEPLAKNGQPNSTATTGFTKV